MDETFYENSGDCPWNRNGSDDAAATWEIRERQARQARAYEAYAQAQRPATRKLSAYQRRYIRQQRTA